MKAVILAAGEGTRLRPFTETMPKVMLPVANKPILEHVIETCKKGGISEIIVVVGYKKEVIMEYFKDYDGLPINFVIQEKQLGTGHALLQVEKKIEDPFIVLSGDNLIDDQSINRLIQSESDFSLLARESPITSKYGSLSVDGDLLKKINLNQDNLSSNLSSTGIYKFPNSIFDILEKLAAEGNYSIYSFIQHLIDLKKQIHILITKSWIDIIYPWDLLAINEEIMHNTSASKSGKIEKNVIIKGKVDIGRGTTIHSGSYIVGPAVIGENCEIGPNVCIFPCTTIGNNSSILPFCEIRNSVIMDDAYINSHSFLSHSIVGNSANIGNHFSCSPGSVSVEIDGLLKKVNRIGAIIGPYCSIGDHVFMDSGKILGRKCNVSPMKRIQQDIPSESNVM
jgi:UDP-N-acetylglucosamine diphosphorylase/glucosamine-1-phosphate N-acetyltransferase